MEQSRPNVPIASPHLEDLRDLVSRPGPFTTIVVARPEPIAKAVEAAVSDTHHLVKNSLSAAAADAVARVVRDAMPHAPGVVIVVEEDRIVLVEQLDEAPAASGLTTGAVPSLAPVIRRRMTLMPTIVVDVDRVGADLSWSEPLPGGAVATTTGGFELPHHQVSKVRGGGWSHRRIQQRAEDSWDLAAAEASEAIVELSERTDPRLIVLGGEGRLVNLIRDALPRELADLVRSRPGGRSEDGGDVERTDEVDRWSRSAIAEDTTALLRKFTEEKGQLDQAVDGLEPTLEALRESRVSTLLAHDDPDDERLGWFVPDEPTLVATEEHLLEDLGADDLRVGRAVDVAIRSALLTGADIRIVPTSPRLFEGIGALLRW